MLTHNENDLLAGFMLDILSRHEHTLSFVHIHFYTILLTSN